MTQWIEFIVNSSSLWFWLVYGLINCSVTVLTGVAAVKDYKKDLEEYNADLAARKGTYFYHNEKKLPLFNDYFSGYVFSGTVVGAVAAAAIIWLFPIVATVLVFALIAGCPILWYLCKELPESPVAQFIQNFKNKYLTQIKNP